MIRVLVVEDAPTVGELLTRTLEAEGYHVVRVAEDFERLLDPADSWWNEVDRLLCDLMLPGAAGLDILTVARDHHPLIRRIALSAAGGDLMHAASLVADRVLGKPAPFDDLLEALA